jgi:tripartite-type tricarboxylate transporter receptor subunit TctC
LKAALTVMACVAFATAAQADSVSDFYKGKTIKLVVGFAAGTGYDAYGRLLARHIGANIPGQPTVVVQDMQGAAGIIAANHLYNTAPNDGLEFGLVSSASLLQPLFGQKEARFDATKFNWVGNGAQLINFCAVNRASGVDSFDQWFATGKELTFGTGGPAAVQYQHPMVLKNILNAHLRLVSGYASVEETSLAMQRGEVDGVCGFSPQYVESQFKSMIASGDMKLIVQTGRERLQSFADVPSVFEYAKTDEVRQILSLAFDQLALGRPFIAPPGIPTDRLEALAKAFQEALGDPALVAEAKAADLDVEYMSGEEAKALLGQFYSYPPSVVEAAKIALGQ